MTELYQHSLMFFGLLLLALGLSAIPAIWWEGKGQREPKQKLFWILVLAFAPIMGVILWWFWGKPKGIKVGPLEIGTQHQPRPTDRFGNPL